MGLVFALLIIGISWNDTESAQAAEEPTLYSVFESREAMGIVEVTNFPGSTVGKIVTARIQKPVSGLVAFCYVNSQGITEGCQTRNPEVSGFDKKGDGGCATFVITFSEEVNRIAITTEDFVVIIALAEMTEELGKGSGRLNLCR